MNTLQKTVWFALLATALFFTSACQDRTGEKKEQSLEGAALNLATQKEDPPPWQYEEHGDLDSLKKRGKLRILMTRHHSTDRLPRGDFPLDHEQNLVTEFCRSQKLEPVFVYVDEHSQLLPWLLAGKGDLVVASLTVTPERRAQVAFSVPLSMTQEILVTRADEHKIKGLPDLAGRKIHVRKSSSYFQTLSKLKDKVPDLQIVAADERLDTEQILNKIAQGQFDLTLADSSLLVAAQRYLSGLKGAFPVTDERPIAWAMRPRNKALRDALNEFLSRSNLIGERDAVYQEDLPEMKKRRVLRVLTRNSASTYFLYRGELIGFEYDLVCEFAKRHDLKVEIIVPPAGEDLLPWLKAGRGDVVAASLTATEKRKASGLALSRFYQKVSEQVIGSKEEQELKSPQDLAGRTLVVRKDSSYYNTLEQLKESGIAIKIQIAPAEMETEEIIDRVAKGEYDLTLADSHIVDIEQTYRKDFKSVLSLGDPVDHVWAVHPENKALLKAINEFFSKEYRGLFYNVTRNKYYKNTRRMAARARLRSKKTGQLSPYDKQVKKYAHRFGMDWRLVTAQMFAESRFDPKAKSWVGAKGLLQVMPKTAKEMGLTDLEKPEIGIHAGVKYLNWTRDRFAKELNPHTRNWFAMAAYNAGIGHVKDAQELARTQGLDPDRWFGNVERAMLLLSRPEYAKKARYGYCRGTEPVNYVADIRERWRAYKRSAQSL